MLASKADIDINGVGYQLDEEEADHYVHTYNPTVVSEPEVVGEPGKRNIRPGRLLWAFDDFSGGEGNRIYYPDEPTKYDRSTTGVNPRIRGQLAGKPTQDITTLSSTASTASFFGVGVGAIWVGTANETWYSTNGTSWSAGPTLGAGHVISAVVGTEDFVYVASVSGGARYIYRCSTATATEVTHGGTVKALGMAMYHGDLYFWTGRKLYRCGFVADDGTANTFPLAAKYVVKVHDTGVDIGSGTYFGGLEASEDSLVFFASSAGNSTIFEYRIVKRSGTQPVYHTGGRAVPIWHPGGLGFTVQSVSVQNQIVYAFGHWGTATDGTGKAQMYLLPLATMQPQAGPFIRSAYSSLHLSVSAPSYGSQILFSDQTSFTIFVYDTEAQAVSELDALSVTATIGDMVTWGPYRYLTYASALIGTKVASWQNDENRQASSTTTYTLDTGNWDNSYPFETKVLLGYHVAFSPMAANQSITIGHQADDSGSFTSLTAITSSTTGNSTGRVFVPVSGTVTYHNLKTRITGSGTSSVAPPIIYSVTAESTILSTEQTFDLVVRVKDETPQNRVSTGQRRGQTLLSNLTTLATTKAVVTFKDGYPYAHQRQAQYDTYSVYVDGMQPVLKKAGEGSVRVRLRVIPS